MKKLISFLVVLVVALSTVTSLGEVIKMNGSFSIRNGIEFGMSVEEVRNIEENITGNELYDYEENSSRIMGNTYKLSYEEDSIAGIPCTGNGGNIKYYFDDEDMMLEAISYWFGYYENKNGIMYYNEICEIMSEKYGAPIFTEDDDEVFYVLTPAFESFLFYVEGNLLKQYAYSQWLVEYENIWVLVDAVMYAGSKPALEVGYRCISAEEMNKIVIDALNEENIKANEQYNDF